jgi:hypothetical protein
MLQAAQLIPSFAFGSWNTVVKSIATSIAPAIGSSVGFVGKWLSDSKPEAESNVSKNRLHWQKEYGVSGEFLDTIMEALFNTMYAESTVGANSEARQCLKKEGDGTWGECEDYEAFVQKLVAKERTHGQEAKLRIDIFFAQDDALVGQRGQRYMEACWSGQGGFADVLEFASSTVDGSDHDSVLTMIAVLEEIVGRVVGVNPDHAPETT